MCYLFNYNFCQIGISLETSLHVLNDLNVEKWIDRQTQALFIEFVTVNLNTDIFMSITLIAEFPDISAVHTKSIIQPFR